MDTNKRVPMRDILHLAELFGLPCIIRSTEITIMGEKKLIVFKRQERDICQLIQTI